MTNELPPDVPATSFWDIAPLPEPYGRITTHTITGQQFFYRWPESPYLDNAKECINVHASADVLAYGDARAAAAVLAERERCAKVCDDLEYEYWRSSEDQEWTPADCATAIRKGGN
jgi:hypothetical protein